MWKTVAKEEKRIKELTESARRRAQRRRAFYDSRLGDPTQLLRVSGTATRLDSGLRPDRDEDGIGNELRFERWHDLVDKIRLHVSEEQCLLDNEEEWNDLVARHHALIGKVSEKYALQLRGQCMCRSRERDTLDTLGKEFYIKDYFRILHVAKAEEDERVNQLKVTAVNLERALAGKKPLKASEIDGLAGSPSKSSRSGSESPSRDKVEYIQEFTTGSPRQDVDSGGDYDYHEMETLTSSSTPVKSASSRTSTAAQGANASRNQPQTTPNQQGIGGIGATKSSLAEKLKQRMRQGLEQSARSNDNKKQAKEQGNGSIEGPWASFGKECKTVVTFQEIKELVSQSVPATFAYVLEEQQKSPFSISI
ncbi:hypothetical protein BGW39_006852 [Mortierella sp. 14UC]|nr:hypothetical protein BGW39_006852 [Mortierella sp. 14UC]